MRILIVKTSSLGDIVQSFDVLNLLRNHFPEAAIDWAVEKSLESIVAAHPLVSKTVALDMKGMKARVRWHEVFGAIRHLRSAKYDLIFDLQGNCKSAVVTGLARGKVKVGFGIRSVREWPNVLATHVRFEVPKQINIRLQHLQLVQQFLKDRSPPQVEGVRFKIEEPQKEQLRALLSLPQLQARISHKNLSKGVRDGVSGLLSSGREHCQNDKESPEEDKDDATDCTDLPRGCEKCGQGPFRVMVCPGSKWINKQLPLETVCQFLQKMQEQLRASFLLVWGAEEEKLFCEEIHSRFFDTSLVVDKLPIPVWQNLMNEVNLVFAVDSSALHLCGTTKTPSFSVFGPTAPEIFKPIGQNHFAFQGKCPYDRPFKKTCPQLRSCATGACIRQLDASEIYAAFTRWWSSPHKKNLQT